MENAMNKMVFVNANQAIQEKAARIKCNALKVIALIMVFAIKEQV